MRGPTPLKTIASTVAAKQSRAAKSRFGATLTNLCSPNTIGEIAVCSPAAMKGYLDENNGFVHIGEKLWIKTGDMGYLDEDGFLFILDRRKRSIKINAINIFPSEVEGVAKQNDNVDEACAIAYHYKEKTFIKLYITLKDQTVNHEKLKT